MNHLQIQVWFWLWVVCLFLCFRCGHNRCHTKVPLIISELYACINLSENLLHGCGGNNHERTYCLCLLAFLFYLHCILDVLWGSFSLLVWGSSSFGVFRVLDQLQKWAFLSYLVEVTLYMPVLDLVYVLQLKALWVENC